MSDREKANLRGPVAEMTEIRVTPAFQNFPESTYTMTFTYDREGRILRTTNLNSSGTDREVFTTAFTYDSDGRLIKRTSGNTGFPEDQSIYSYDDQGRLIGISGGGDFTTTFQYEETGRKTRTVTSTADPATADREHASTIMFSSESDDLFLPAPPGGSVKTLFNERGQATESKTYDAHGNLLSSLIYTFDTNGRLLETSYRLEGLEFTLPLADRQQFIADPQVARDFQEQLTKFLGEKREFSRESYLYDSDGRLIEKRTHVGPSMKTITKIAYNNHFDKLEEITTTTGDLNPQAQDDAGALPAIVNPPSADSRVLYSYKYDEFGNWTEQVVSSPSGPGDRTVIRRTLKYY